MVRAITVERYLIAGKLLFLTVDFTLHETQLAVIIKAHTDVFRGFTVDIEFNKLEFIAQKAAELGARRLVPVKMRRSVVKLTAEEGRKKQERLDRIAREALKQCGRTDRLEILEPVGFSEAVAMFREEDMMLMPWEEARGRRVRDEHQDNPGAHAVGILIGPEGGITREEAQAAVEAGAKPVTLGPRILRAETAAVAAMAIAMHLWGDL